MSMEVTERDTNNDMNETRDTLFLLGGAALIVFGAGLILSTPMIRRSWAASVSATWCRPPSRISSDI